MYENLKIYVKFQKVISKPTIILFRG